MVGNGGNGGVFVSLTKRVMSPDVRRSWAGCVKWKSVWFTSGCCKIWKVVGGNELIGLSFWDTQRYWLVWPRRKTCLEMRWQQLVAWRWKWLGGGIPWHFQRRTAWGSFWHDGHPKDSWTTGCSRNTEVQIATIGGQIPLAAVQLVRLKHWSMNQTCIYIHSPYQLVCWILLINKSEKQWSKTVINVVYIGYSTAPGDIILISHSETYYQPVHPGSLTYCPLSVYHLKTAGFHRIIFQGFVLLQRCI